MFGMSGRSVLICSVVVGVVVAGTAYATIPDANGVIHGCFSSKDGTLRVIDSGNQACTSKETALSWSQQGPAGPPGPSGSPGPRGPAGTVASLDDLEGVPCTGVAGKIATVHLHYGTGIEAPVEILCITHLVLNPGPFTVHVDQGSAQVGLVGPVPLPAADWSLAGSIDTGGLITVPDGGFTIPDVPWQTSGNGFSASGTVSLTSQVRGGSLDPGSGQAELDVDAYATVTVDATSTLGIGYQGTCQIASAQDPLHLTFTNAAGTHYDQTDGSATLSADFDAPALSSCSPELPGFASALLQLLAGSSRVTFSGTVDPVIKAP